MIRFPNGDGAGTICDKFCYHHDIATTICKACGISSKGMDGKDLHRLVQEDDLNYYDHVTVAWGGSVAVFDGEFWYNGYVWDIDGGSLYDVRKDPKLMNDIISKHPDKAKELLKLSWDDAHEPIDMEYMQQFKDCLGCTPVTTKLTKFE
jgi:arylsulfatase A-like enzyme